MRSALVTALKSVDCPPPSSLFKDWDHITSQASITTNTALDAHSFLFFFSKMCL